MQYLHGINWSFNIKKEYLICFLQHRDVNYSIVAFLHLHAALNSKAKLGEKCKIVFACTLHNSPELRSLKSQFSDLYDIDIFECDGPYLLKINAIFKKYSVDDYPFFIKHDEDIFISKETWISFLENSSLKLNSHRSLLTTVNLSTGIPSWRNFCQSFFTSEEIEFIGKELSQSPVPNRLWGNDYSPINEYLKTNNLKWNEDGYWGVMNRLGYHYRGLHPIRVFLKFSIYINNIILKRYSSFQNKIPSNKFEEVSDRYLCNSFFCIKYQKYKKIINDNTLFVDLFDEVPINSYALKNQLNFCFLKDSLGIHIIYNSVYDEKVVIDNKTYSGREVEGQFLDSYLLKIQKYLIDSGDITIKGVNFYKPSLYRRIRRYLQRFDLLVNAYRLIKRLFSRPNT